MGKIVFYDYLLVCVNMNFMNKFLLKLIFKKKFVTIIMMFQNPANQNNILLNSFKTFIYASIPQYNDH